jgi:hypothetical protein
MEAKDILIKILDEHETKFGYSGGDRSLAEISFKAGIKEVVDWINQNSTKEVNEYQGHILLQRFIVTEWHTKLKEWGVE